MASIVAIDKVMEYEALEVKSLFFFFTSFRVRSFCFVRFLFCFAFFCFGPRVLSMLAKSTTVLCPRSSFYFYFAQSNHDIPLVVQVRLVLSILLPWPPECLHHKCELPCPAENVCGSILCLREAGDGSWFPEDILG